MADDAIAKFLKRRAPKPKSVSIDEFLKTPVPAPEPVTPAPTPGFLENLKIGGQRALLSAADAGRVMEDALGAATRGDFAPIGQLIEQAGRGAAPFVSGLTARPELAGQTFLAEQTAQAPRVGEITAAREARMDTDPQSFSREARAERARLDELAGRDPSLAGKITRRTTEGVATAIPSMIAGAATGGSVPAMATMAGIQSMNAPEMLVPNVALAATPLPLGKVIAPIVRRIKAGRVAVEAIPPAPVSIEPVAPRVAPEIPVISPERPLPAVEARTPFPATLPDVPLNPAQLEAAALNSAIQKLGTDSADEIAEMIANANRRFNKTVSAPGEAKRSITPVERQSMREDYQRVSALTREENAALAEVLPERTFSPVNDPAKSGRVVTVSGEEVRLTPQQEARWKIEVDQAIADAKQSAKMGGDPRYNAEVLKGRMMQISAKKREIISSTPAEESAPAVVSRNISDIPLDEPSAQLDANLRQLKAFFGSRDIVQESRIAAAVGQSADDPAIVSTRDLGLETVPVPVRPVDAVPVTRLISVDDISLGRDTLSKGRIFQAQESLKGGVKPETKGVPLRQQVEPMTVVPDPARPGKFIVEDDGNHRIALLKLQGVTDDIPVKSFETPAQTSAIRSTAGPRAGEIAPMEVEIADQLRQAIERNMDPLEIESMAGARQIPLFDPRRNMAELQVGSMRDAAQAPLLEVAPRKSALRKALNIAADVYNIPRAIMSSGDVSFPFRQGAIFLVPPSRWGRSGRAMVEMFRALIPDRPTSLKSAIKAQFQPKTERYQRMVDAIASDLDAQTGMESGLKLTSQTGGFLRGKEEVFGSRIADRIPMVRETQQAYTMAADYTRLNTFKLYKQVIDKRAKEEGFSADQIKRGYEAAARWINIGSGRGNLGEKADRAMDALGIFAFSPRFTASRIQVLNPWTYLRNAGTPEGRAVLKLQMSELAQFTAMVGGTLFLAKQAGFKVETRADRPNFLQLSLGNYHYDGLAGLQPVMRLVYAIAADAARIAKGEEKEKGQRGALDVGSRFLRSKAAPIPSFFVDYFDEKDYEGKPFDLTRASVERVTPMMWNDFAEAFQREGLGGPFMLSPGGIGLGARYFEPKPIDAAIEQRPSLLTELTRLQVRIADPRRKPGESDEAYKRRSQAVADLYGRYGVSLMSDRDYASLPEQTKQEVFDLLHSRILHAVNTRDRRTGQFQVSQLINSLRKSAKQKTIRERLISRRAPL